MILDLLHKVCTQLDEHDIKYMVSGSIALNIFAIPRMTWDIDIVIELSEMMVEEFTDLFPDSYFEKDVIKLDEFDRNLKLEEVVYSLKEFGHNELLVNAVEEGLKNSSIRKEVQKC